jgi:hypothetical protein
VGIGTATPAYRFDMPAGDMAISGRLLGLTSPGNLFWLGLRGTATESQRLAIGINGDPITGILSGVQMGINSGGLFVNSSNYVGIGTATPSAQLSIHGNTSSWSSTSLLGITNTNATPNASLYLIAPNMTANQPHAITLGKALTQYNSMQWIYTHIANDSTDNYMNFTPYGGTVNGIGCLYLRATGNVGIGVTNPFGFFQIACTSSTSQESPPDGGGSHGLVFTSPKTGASVYAMAMGVDFTTGRGYINGAGNSVYQSILLQSRGGNVGIGTTNPSNTLHVYGGITTTSAVNVSSGTDTYQTVGLNIYNSTTTPSSEWQFSVAGSNGPQTPGAFYIYGSRISVTGNFALVIQPTTGNVSITGSLSKGSGTFDIAHPLYSDHKKRLVHSFIEGPRCDLIYRGTKQLINGTITIDINKECTYNPNGAMDDGTFEALCANAECFLQNKSSFARVMGTISGCILTITCENASNDTIVWMVIAERKDSFIKKWNRTDDNGFLITQYTDENHLDM